LIAASESLLAAARKGDKRSIARLLTIVENDEPGSADVLRALYPETGHARIVGVTGPPGGGKSTLVSRLAAEYGVTDRCLVASFSADFLRRLRECDADIASSFLFDHPVALPESGQRTPLFPPVDGIGPRRDLVAPPLLAQAAGAGLTVHPWTADNPEEIQRLLEYRVSSITTNVPDVALALRAQAGSTDPEVFAQEAPPSRAP